MARQDAKLTRAWTTYRTGLAVSLGFLGTCGVLMLALSLQLPVTLSEAEILGRARFGAATALPVPALTEIVIRLGTLFLPPVLAERGLFVLAALLAGLGTLRLATIAGFGPIAGNLGLAWAFSTVLVMLGGAVAGPGPLGMLAVTLHALCLFRLLRADRAVTWGLAWAATVAMVISVPELAPACLAVAMAPVLLPDCRKWLLRPGYWAVIASAVLLVIPAAQINRIDILWPAVSLSADPGWPLAVCILGGSPVLVLASAVSLSRGPGRPAANPHRTLLFLIALGVAVSLPASGFKPSVCLAILPILSILAADSVLSGTGRLNGWLAEHVLPLTAAGLIVVLAVVLVSRDSLIQRLPPLQAAAGWAGTGHELAALADQNGVAWIAVDNWSDAHFLDRALPVPIPVVVVGADNRRPANCSRPGLYLAQGTLESGRPDIFAAHRILMPVTRHADGGPIDERSLAVVERPSLAGFCAL